MMRQILVSCGNDHGISRIAMPTDPGRHVPTAVGAELEVEQMKDGIIARSRIKQVGLGAMIHGSPRGDGTAGLASTVHFSRVVAQQTGGAQQKGRLPRAARANEREGFSRRDAKADSTEHIDRCDASAGAGGKSFRESAELEGDDHLDRYPIALRAATSRPYAHHRNVAIAVGRAGALSDGVSPSAVSAAHALLLRPNCSA
jgi:hypothetical protein